MNIGGVQWTSLMDYPHEISIVLATSGCNLRCKYCHNPFLFNLNQSYTEEELLEQLETRKKVNTAVVITGGEPTLQPDLIPFMKKLKLMGYKVKLDTNGTDPETIKKALEEKCVDYIAMDLKAPLHKYEEITQVKIPEEKLLESMKIIKESGVNHEFRTTAYPGLTEQDFKKMKDLLKGARNYYIQQFNPEMSYQMKDSEPLPLSKLEQFKIITDENVHTGLRA